MVKYSARHLNPWFCSRILKIRVDRVYKGYVLGGQILVKIMKWVLVFAKF